MLYFLGNYFKIRVGGSCIRVITIIFNIMNENKLEKNPVSNKDESLTSPLNYFRTKSKKKGAKTSDKQHLFILFQIKY